MNNFDRLCHVNVPRRHIQFLIRCRIVTSSKRIFQLIYSYMRQCHFPTQLVFIFLECLTPPSPIAQKYPYELSLMTSKHFHPLLEEVVHDTSSFFKYISILKKGGSISSLLSMIFRRLRYNNVKSTEKQDWYCEKWSEVSSSYMCDNVKNMKKIMIYNFFIKVSLCRRLKIYML